MLPWPPVAPEEHTEIIDARDVEGRTEAPRHSLALALGPGAVAGDYVIQRELGRGGCGVVYEALHRVIGRRAAIKVLHAELASSPEMIERFVREARAVNAIRHPHIADVYELGTLLDGRPYLVMALLAGVSLQAVLDDRGCLGPADAVAIALPLCDALHAAHEAGYIHRDVKAGNVIVEQRGDRWHVTLIDFGIAKLLEPDEDNLTSRGRVVGTPQAMAPEQLRGEPVDARTDVYALGVLLHRMLAGPRGTGRLPAGLDRVVERAMAVEPAERFPSARALAEALGAASVVELGLARAEPAGATTPDVTRPAALDRRAVGVYLHVDTLAHGEAADSDALLDRLDALLDAAERTLEDAGMRVALVTGNAIVAVRLLDEPGRDGPGDVPARRCAIDAALAIAGALGSADRGELPALPVSIAVRLGAVWTRDRGRERFAITGGPLTRLADWPEPIHDGRVHVDRAVVAGLARGRDPLDRGAARASSRGVLRVRTGSSSRRRPYPARRRARR